MQRLVSDEGHFISETAMQAPKDAKKAWDEGLVLLTKNQRPEALASFQKAVKAYPKFADARLRIGITQVQLKLVEPAKESFRKANMALGNLSNLHTQTQYPWGFHAHSIRTPTLVFLYMTVR